VDTSKKSDIPNAGPPLVTNGVAPSVAEIADVPVDDQNGTHGPSAEDSSLGLSRAIVNCIMLTTGERVSNLQSTYTCPLIFDMVYCRLREAYLVF
jgi:hypothetical protein